MSAAMLRPRLAGLALLAAAAALPAAAETPTMVPTMGMMDGAYSLALGLSLRPIHGTLEVAAAASLAPRSMDELMLAATQSGVPADALVRAEVVALAEMADMRAGFDAPGGVTVRFGFDISHSVNGQVMQRLVMPTSTITPNAALPISITDSQGTRLLPGASLPQELQTLANGGLTNITTSLGANGIMSLVQNRADNQVIQRTAMLNFDISGLRNMLTQSAANNLVAGALTARRMLGR